MSASATCFAAPATQRSTTPCAMSLTTGFASARRSIAADKRLQDGSDTRNDRRDNSKGNHMIEAEWWDYDSLDELADAVAGDVGFIVESAVDARGASLVAVPGDATGSAIFRKLVKQQLPWKRVTVIPTDEKLVAMDDERSNVRAIAKTFLPAGAR